LGEDLGFNPLARLAPAGTFALARAADGGAAAEAADYRRGENLEGVRPPQLRLQRDHLVGEHRRGEQRQRTAAE
jgi:hypothetical protein